jgi:hypothetical protein
MACKWFYLATCLSEPDGIGFVLKDYWGYIPAIELCVCYSMMHDYIKAREYNELAGKFFPDSEAVKANRRYLESVSV